MLCWAGGHTTSGGMYDRSASSPFSRDYVKDARIIPVQHVPHDEEQWYNRSFA